MLSLNELELGRLSYNNSDNGINYKDVYLVKKTFHLKSSSPYDHNVLHVYPTTCSESNRGCMM